MLSGPHKHRAACKRKRGLAVEAPYDQSKAESLREGVLPIRTGNDRLASIQD